MTAVSYLTVWGEGQKNKQTKKNSEILCSFLCVVTQGSGSGLQICLKDKMNL